MPNGYRAVLLTFYVPVGLALYLHTLQHLFGRKKKHAKRNNARSADNTPRGGTARERRGRRGEEQTDERECKTHNGKEKEKLGRGRNDEIMMKKRNREVPRAGAKVTS